MPKNLGEITRREFLKLAGAGLGAAATGAWPTLAFGNEVNSQLPKIAYSAAYVKIGSSKEYIDIFTMNLDGSNKIQLTNNPLDDIEPAWSPDGKQLVFIRRKSNVDDHYRLFDYGIERRIYIINFNGSEEREITPNPVRASKLTWSPDGKKIAFSDFNGHSNSGIYIMNVDRRDLQRLTNTEGYDHSPDWSPDGEKIVFSSDRDAEHLAESDIYIINVDGTGLKRLTYMPNAAKLRAAWSPDGKKIAFISNEHAKSLTEEDYWIIFIMDPEGGDSIRLTPNIPYDPDLPPLPPAFPAHRFITSLDWLPDGSKILYTADNFGPYHGTHLHKSCFFTVDVNNKDIKQLNHGGLRFNCSVSPV